MRIKTYIKTDKMFLHDIKIMHCLNLKGKKIKVQV